MLHATHRRLQRLSQFVRPSPPGSGESPIVSALNAACDVEDEMEGFLEEALAKLDGISRKLDQKVDVLSECILERDEWYREGKMFWLDVDEVKKALAQATITDARDFRLHVEQAVTKSMCPQELARLANTFSCRPQEGFRLKTLASIAYLGRFGAAGTRQAFHLLVFISTHEWADEPCPSRRKTRPGNRPMGVGWKLFARLIGSGPDKQVEFLANREDIWEEFAGIAVPDWKLPGYWDFCAAYRTIRRGKTRSGSCYCPMRKCVAERRQDWLREQAVNEVKGKLTLLAPADLPVELMDIILDFALREEGLVDG